MRVLISAYACAPNKGSEPGFGWNWTIEIASLGHEVWCFTTPGGKQAIQDAMKNHPDLKVKFIYIDVPG